MYYDSLLYISILANSIYSSICTGPSDRRARPQKGIVYLALPDFPHKMPLILFRNSFSNEKNELQLEIKLRYTPTIDQTVQS